MSSRFPDFLGIGAQKAGTTWLYEQLRRHPDVWLPPEKELHYFDRKRGAGQSLRAKVFGDGFEDRAWRQQLGARVRSYREGGERALGWDVRYFFGRRTDGWYASLFRAGDG